MVRNTLFSLPSSDKSTIGKFILVLEPQYQTKKACLSALRCRHSRCYLYISQRRNIRYAGEGPTKYKLRERQGQEEGNLKRQCRRKSPHVATAPPPDPRHDNTLKKPWHRRKILSSVDEAPDVEGWGLLILQISSEGSDITIVKFRLTNNIPDQ